MEKISAFTKKVITVQDYPDPSKKITIYGKSKTSKFKLNDSVIIINNDRVGAEKRRVIGFDRDGDVMLEFCPWSNTRGGYTDPQLDYYSEFKKLLKIDLPPNLQEELDEKIDNQKKFMEIYPPASPKDKKVIMDRVRSNFFMVNYSRIKSSKIN